MPDDARERATPGLAHYAVELDPEPGSAKAARTAVAAALESVGRADLVDTAALLVSELVTNSIVHAHTAIGVTLTATADGVRVEVGDHSPHLPTRREYGHSATTGRGLELVELLADDSGSYQVADSGKVVWFSLGTTAGATSVASEEAADSPRGDVAVLLHGLPVALYRAWQQHADALLREYLLASFDESADPAELEQHGQASDAFTVLTRCVTEAAGDATDGGIDVVLHVTGEDVQQFVVLDAVLDKVADLATRGELLSPPTQPEVRALRRWINQQVARQSAGLAPEPWTGIDAGAPPPVRPPVAWDDADVTSSSVALVAADDTNRLIAVSAAAGELLGWRPAELVGRRIVTMIPERFRETHVAAFTLHLLSGEARILGRPVTVPALRRDGSEVMVELLVRRETADQDRPVFVARLTPVDG